MLRVRRTICIITTAAAALHCAPACAGESQSEWERGHSQDSATRPAIATIGAATVRNGPADAEPSPASLCRNCDYESRAVRQFLPGDMTWKFRPVGGTFSLHF